MNALPLFLAVASSLALPTDLHFTRAASPSLLMLPCSSSPLQQWTVDGGRIGVIAPLDNSGDSCLCAPTSGASGPLSLQQCEGAGAPLHRFEVGFNFSGAAVAPIPWLPDNAAPASGLCVTAAAPQAAPQLQPCTGAAAQTWQLAGARLSTADGALCLAQGVPPLPLVSSVFGSEQVFQRGASVDLWGAASPGGQVRVTLSGFAPVQVTAAANGSWAASLPPMPAGTGFNITVQDLSSGGMQVLTDVAFGDVVWCSGQVRGWKCPAAPLPLLLLLLAPQASAQASSCCAPSLSLSHTHPAPTPEQHVWRQHAPGLCIQCQRGGCSLHQLPLGAPLYCGHAPGRGHAPGQPGGPPLHTLEQGCPRPCLPLLSHLLVHAQAPGRRPGPRCAPGGRGVRVGRNQHTSVAAPQLCRRLRHPALLPRRLANKPQRVLEQSDNALCLCGQCQHLHEGVCNCVVPGVCC